ncbi:MAG: magnesium/cobalt transporter CorA [Deltaproteobacteria bacterium]|nr:magnesium/cobalt transporter CorA [Deltaproteobacteria bacterium]
MIVNCVAYQNGQRLTNIPVSDIHSYISQTDCFVWVALNDATPEEIQAMQEEFGLHDLALEDAQHGHERPKLEEYDGFLFAVLQMIERSGDQLNVGEVGIFGGANYVLSVRSRAERGFTEVRARCEREPELLRHGSGYVLYALMDVVVDRYFPILDELETEIENIEDRMFANQSARENIEALYDLKRKLMILKHATEPLLEATGKLFGGRVPQLAIGLQDYFRDIYDHLQRLHQSIDSLRDMVTTAISVAISLITIQENEVTKQLAAYGALIAVPTLIAGIYGMNFQHMPELNSPLGYPLTLAGMLAIDLYMFTRFRKAKWI